MPPDAPVYLIELCSGERRRWQLLSDPGEENPLWRDCETGTVFREASLLYAWKIVGEADAAGSDDPDLP